MVRGHHSLIMSRCRLSLMKYDANLKVAFFSLEFDVTVPSFLTRV